MQLQFQEGDWVLLSRADTPYDRGKLYLKWQGPFQVQQVVSRDIYKVRSLLGTVEEVHGCRLWFYAPVEFQPLEELRRIFIQQNRRTEIRKVKQIYLTQGHWKVKISWRGLEDHQDSVKDFMEILERYPKKTRQAVKKLTDEQQMEVWHYVSNRIQQDHELRYLKVTPPYGEVEFQNGSK